MSSCYNLRDVVKVNIHLSLMVEAVICLFINEFKKPPLRKRKLLEQEQENNIVKKMIQRVLVNQDQDLDQNQNPKNQLVKALLLRLRKLLQNNLQKFLKNANFHELKLLLRKKLLPNLF